MKNAIRVYTTPRGPLCAKCGKDLILLVTGRLWWSKEYLVCNCDSSSGAYTALRKIENV